MTAPLAGQSVTLPPGLDAAVQATLAAWRTAGNVKRLWARDASLWTGAGESAWLGWIDNGASEAARTDDRRRFADDVRRDGFSHALLLGMGGSSLGAEVIAETFGATPGHPRLIVLDATDPAQIRSVERRIDLARTLFIVSSKSGTTLEPNILMQYFLARAADAVGAVNVGAHAIAITDPGSALEAEARRRGFRRVFHGLPGIGGRYSVMSAFGLVPAAIIGVDCSRLVAAAQRMADSCGAGVEPAANPGVVLGVVLGVAAREGRDKATIIASPGLAGVGAWLEQLIAESTGKRGRGIIPVDGEPLGPPSAYGSDRLFVHLALAGDDDAAQRRQVASLDRAGHPVVRIDVADRYDLGGEFFRWQIATAVAGAVIGVDPFDQPDVEASKVKTRELTDEYDRTGALPDESGHVAIADHAALAASLRALLATIGAGDYCAFLAFLERNEHHVASLTRMRALVRDRLRIATSVGFGPRFLHSTGQLHKGGKASGVFLQLTAAPDEDLPVPGQRYGFGVVEAAQALGDFAVLAERGRRVLRIDLGNDVAAGLAALEAALGAALA